VTNLICITTLFDINIVKLASEEGGIKLFEFHRKVNNPLIIAIAMHQQTRYKTQR
jgi:hypothetical protein